MRASLTIQRLSLLARDLAEQADEPSTVSRIVELATELLPCSAADVVQVGHDGNLSVTASTDPVRSELAAFEADGGGLLCRVLGIGQSSLQPVQHAPIEHPFASGTSRHYVLRFHPIEPADWTEPVAEAATAFADIAAVALDRAIFRDEANSLAVGLDSNRLIGTAIGILMANGRTTYDTGFGLLKACSQRTNRKLRQIAEDVVLTGQLPDRTVFGAA